MKMIKNSTVVKCFVLFMGAGILTLSSCSTKSDEPVIPTQPGTSTKGAHVSITNAVEGSSPQDFYLDNLKVSSGAVGYGQSSSYISTTEGSHSALFANAGSVNATAAATLSFTASQYYTIYFGIGANGFGDAVLALDDLTPPANGKAKVRFIQLSPAITTDVDFGVTATNKLSTGLTYKAISAYYSVDPGTTFFLYEAGLTTVKLSIPVNLQAGKIYTIFITGNTEASLKYYLALQS